MGERIRHHCLIRVACNNGYKKKKFCNDREAPVGLPWTEMREQLSREDDQKNIVKVKTIRDDDDGRRLEGWRNTAVRPAG